MKKLFKKLLNKLGYDIVKLKRKGDTKKVKDKKEVKDDDDYLYRNYPTVSLDDRRFYNIGAGFFFHKYWTNVDYGSQWYSKIQRYPFVSYNLMECKPLPFAYETAEIVYTGNTIEHVTDDAVLNLFKESFRILKQGGGIRITCPDAKLLYETLVRNDILFWDFRASWEGFKDVLPEVAVFDYFVREVATSRCRFVRNEQHTLIPNVVKELFYQLDYESFMNEICSKCSFNSDKPGYHINWWDEDKLMKFLKQAGFQQVYVSRYSQSKFPPLRNINLFDTDWQKMSLYIEAIK